MTRRPTSLRVTLFLAGFAACVASLTALASGPPTKSACEELKAWAEPYRHQALSLDGLVTFDRAHRAAIFSAVTPETKASLWREQLGRLASQPGLTDQQRELAREGVSLISPALYQDAAGKARMDDLWTRVQTAFDKETLRLWTDIGYSSKNPVSATRTASCGCATATAWYDCPFSGVCFTGGCDRIQACGPAGTGICEGTCA